MTQLTDSDLAYLRSEVGSDPDEDTLQELYDRLGSLVKVAAEVISGKLALLEGQASSTSLSIPGVISESESYDATIRALTARQTRLLAAVATEDAVPLASAGGVGSITRRDRVR